MKKNCTHIFVTTLLLWMISMGCYAQKTDSITSKHLVLREKLWDFFKESPATYQTLPITDFTETSLYSTIKKQTLSKVQTPNQVQYFGFKSKGIYSLKSKTKLFGSLNFSRSYAQESSYLLFYPLADEFSRQLLVSPNYPLAIRSGNHENSHYHLTGGVSGMVKNKIPYSVSIHYDLDQFFGLNAPKTEQELISYKGNLEVGYPFKNQQFLGRINLGKEQNNFDFSSEGTNSTSINSIDNPETYAAFSVGYGDVLGYNSTLLAGIIDTETIGYGGSYVLRLSQHLFTFTYEYTESNERYYATDYIDIANLAAVFNRIEQKWKGRYYYQKNNHTLLANTSLYYGKGTNTHAFENFVENSENLIVKTNYQQELTQVLMDLYWEKRKNQKIMLGVVVNTKIRQDTKVDLHTTNQKITSFNLGLQINRDVKINKKSFCNIYLGADYYSPLSYSLSYQSSNSSTNITSVIPPRNTFGQDVIVSNYSYETLKKMKNSVGINYQTNLKKKTVATFKIQLNSTVALQNTTQFNDATQMELNMSLNLNY